MCEDHANHLSATASVEVRQLVRHRSAVGDVHAFSARKKTAPGNIVENKIMKMLSTNISDNLQIGLRITWVAR